MKVAVLSDIYALGNNENTHKIAVINISICKHIGYKNMTANPLIERIKIPGETFRLPSGGLFYEPGILSEKVIDGEIYVWPMTAIDEIALKTPDLLFSGDAITQVFARCIPDVIKPGKMLAKDIDFLLICLRKVSYGPHMEISYTHNCENAKEHSYISNVEEFLKKSKRIDPNKINKDFHVTLKNGQIVHMEPISFENYIALMQVNDTDVTPEKLTQRLIFSVSKIIKSVDGDTDTNHIQEWLSKIPPMLMKQVTDSIEKTTEWGPDFMTTVKCRDCGQEVQVQAPLNPLAFFT